MKMKPKKRWEQKMARLEKREQSKKDKNILELLNFGALVISAYALGLVFAHWLDCGRKFVWDWNVFVAFMFLLGFASFLYFYPRRLIKR